MTAKIGALAFKHGPFNFYRLHFLSPVDHSHIPTKLTVTSSTCFPTHNNLHSFSSPMLTLLTIHPPDTLHLPLFYILCASSSLGDNIMLKLLSAEWVIKPSMCCC